jgi:hypothetical protein
MYSKRSRKMGYEKIKPIPTAIELSSIDSNMVTQWIARRGPSIVPGSIKSLNLKPFLMMKVLRKMLPKRVLMPTRESEVISDVRIINGIVPQEIASTIIPK